jgi:hypothetical protein
MLSIVGHKVELKVGIGVVEVNSNIKGSVSQYRQTNVTLS